MGKIYKLLLLGFFITGGLAACKKTDMEPPKNNNIVVPTTLTPNGDGQNDSFYVRTLNLSYYLIEIRSPQDVLVYRSFDPERAWDGTYKNNLLPAGTYSWTIDYEVAKGSRQTMKGTVELIR